jgi:glycosyltransferase involved in cell wall biosynthesis
MDISVVIPCFNEAENISILYERLKDTLGNLKKSYEMIFVDDGSIDQTTDFVKKLKANDNNIGLIVLGRNLGKDAALSAGFRQAKGTVIVTIDSDLQNYPQDAPLLLSKLEEYDAVIGWRQKRHDHFLKIISSQVANFVRRKILEEDLHDAGCGLRAFKKECLEGLENFRFFDLFLMSMLTKLFIILNFNGIIKQKGVYTCLY